MGDLELHLISSTAAVAGFKKCSKVLIDKSVYDFVHHATLSDVLLDCKFSSWSCVTNAEALEVELKS